MDTTPRNRRSRVAVQVAILLVGFAISVIVRPSAVAGIVVVGLILVPLERLVPFRTQPILRPGLVCDLTHMLLTALLTTVATVATVVFALVTLAPLRRLDLVGSMPRWAASIAAFVVVFVGAYVGHRASHRVPWLWRFHSIHHSCTDLDWIAAARQHPVDAAITQAFSLVPLVALGYGARPLAGVAGLLTILAVIQHANLRLRFPYIRWIIPTPEWHHWHHAIDDGARDHNFGLPIIDLVFGTSYLPHDRRPSGFGITEPVPPEDYLAQLRYPLRRH